MLGVVLGAVFLCFVNTRRSGAFGEVKGEAVGVVIGVVSGVASEVFGVGSS